MSKDFDRLHLLITSGLHRGVQVTLQQGALWVVGGDESADVCLADDGIAARHFAIARNGEDLTIRPLDGEIVVDGKARTQTTAVALAEVPRIRMAPTDVTMCLAGSLAALPTVDQVSSPDKAPKRNSGRSFALTVALFSAGMLAVVLSMAGGREADHPVAVVPIEQRVLNVIEDLGLDKEVHLNADRLPIEIRGALTLPALQNLRQRVHEQGIEVTLRVTTVHDLLDQVAGVFRTNGYTAKLAYAGQGTVVVENLDGDSPAIQRVADFTRSDVSGLRQLRFAPASAPEIPHSMPAVYRANPGKRLTTIIDGETAYVATEDGARYFVGAQLPGGHRIRKITSQGVQVELNSEISWLQF